jgi:hypothetical protein
MNAGIHQLKHQRVDKVDLARRIRAKHKRLHPLACALGRTTGIPLHEGLLDDVPAFELIHRAAQESVQQHGTQVHLLRQARHGLARLPVIRLELDGRCIFGKRLYACRRNTVRHIETDLRRRAGNSRKRDHLLLPSTMKELFWCFAHGRRSLDARILGLFPYRRGRLPATGRPSHLICAVAQFPGASMKKPRAANPWLFFCDARRSIPTCGHACMKPARGRIIMRTARLARSPSAPR